ncbi:NAD(P)H-hydrate epimerase [Pseudarthrobacter sp. PS3-L1]|uniref:NAD(P)H-hydrate epimerase n=1 Tax=Pseudarthrobacter sp. PS3-L1 TaxID=3046207 RepID=UPI0024B8A21A|nr:NAD(P)H-hydrate epimerase [Pseudarthrobacter sp. PS3-L1]MDJ0321319.1 NAD(P)H-hydrate epimerase [Pseudarthrobacter sp. PS3-L1]
MISAYTGNQVREAEKPLLDQGMGAVLMQRAAFGLAGAVARELQGRGARLYGSSAVVLVGQGNNGGDGLFAAALLARRGLRVRAVLIGPEAHSQGLSACRKAFVEVLNADQYDAGWLAERCLEPDVVVDALLGTGSKGALRGMMASVAEILDGTEALVSSGRRRPIVIACDVPSGLDSTAGTTAGSVIRADLTVTFGGVKVGTVVDPGADASGRVELVDIGLEPYLPQPSLRRLETGDLGRLLPHPGRRSQKYTRGVLGIIAGTAAYPGAAVLACRGALAAGVGMVRYLGPPEVADAVRAACPEVVCSSGSVDSLHVQAWLVGPGMDSSDQAQLERARQALASGLPVVADAGALPVLPAELGAHVLLTPHAGELASLMARLGIDADRKEIEADTLQAVRKAAAASGATVLLKGATTVIAHPDGEVFSQADGVAWMATAGSGDVLGGIAGALMAQLGHNAGAFAWLQLPEQARFAVIGAMAASLHGRAGAQESSGGPVSASGIAAEIPAVWAKISELSNKRPTL